MLAASGTFGYGVEFRDLVDLKASAALWSKGFRASPWTATPLHGCLKPSPACSIPSAFRTSACAPSSATNCRSCATCKRTVFANIFGYAIEDYVEVARILEDAEGLPAYELNVSCPNTKHGGIFFSSDPGSARRSGRRP